MVFLRRLCLMQSAVCWSNGKQIFHEMVSAPRYEERFLFITDLFTTGHSKQTTFMTDFVLKKK